MATLATRARYALAGFLMKSAQMAFVSEWVKTSWLTPTFSRLTSEGYGANAAVFMCVSALAFKYNEPLPVVKDPDGEPLPKHQLQRLINRPNPMMSHAELMNYIIIYKAIGGQCYLHKVRNRLGTPIELWPYHAGQVTPVPSRYDWLLGYDFDQGNGEKVRVPVEDVIHLKWPSIDLEQPWMALPPLRAAAREVDTDSEATRYLYALLKNDATPRTILNVKTSLTEQQFERLRQQFSLRHGGDNRGGIGLVEGDATISRLSMNLQELAFEGLRRVPESRIAGVFRVPPILAGLYVGLEKSTYSNYREARSQLTEDTFVPLWKADGTELSQALTDDFGGEAVVEYDLSKIAALQENVNEKFARSTQAFASNAVGMDEYRAMIGLPPWDQVRPGDKRGLLLSYELPMVHAPEVTPPQPTILDVTPQPPQLTDDQKRYPFPVSLKAKRDDSTETLQERMRRELEAYLKAQYEAAAASL